MGRHFLTMKLRNQIIHRTIVDLTSTAAVHIKLTISTTCVAAVSFPFLGGDRTSKRKSGRARKHAWDEQKDWGEVGRG